MTSTPIWVPDAARVAASPMRRFIEANGFDDYAELHEWSVSEPEAFWSALWDEVGVVGDRGERTIEYGETMRATRFFPEASLNVAENILWGQGAPDGDVMLVVLDERGGPAIEWTRGDVRSTVASVAAALRADGVGIGDVVAAWMPNCAETFIAMLAATSLGAVFTSTSSDFGIDGVLDRFQQVAPKVLIAADGYYYNGKPQDCLERLDAIRAALPELQRTVVVSVLGVSADSTASADGATAWDAWIAPHTGASLEFERVPFDHPWYVLYSSGTTGVPKCIVHSTGGVFLQHAKEHRLHSGIVAGDRVFYFTTCGWMMWNWLVSAPATGAAIVLYDGSPFHPGPERLWDLAERERFTFFGTSAKYLDSLRKAGFDPRSAGGLERLRVVASTGSPLSPETNSWAVEHLPAAVHLASISGGTDLCATFVTGDPTSPVYAGAIQRPTLGMAIGVLDDDGTPMPVGERGELSCTRPFPSMPLRFGNDPDGERYRTAYFERDPQVWSHGDFASWTAEGGIVIHGRSDTTLNPGGVRIGTAEIYRRVEEIPEVLESLAFGQNHDDDVRVVLLVRLADGATLDDDLIARIKHTIRVGCTPRHVPAVIVDVDDLPRTRSGKLAELAVTDAANGRPVRNTSALANPEAIWAIAERFY